MDLDIGRREFLRYGIGLAITTMFVGILPGCRDMLDKLEKDKKTYPAGTPLGELVRKGYVVSKVEKGDWQTTWNTTFGGPKITAINGTVVATFDVTDVHGYVNPTVGVGEYQLGSWRSMTWYDFNYQRVFTVTA